MSVTISDVMRLAHEAAHKRATPANWYGLEAAVQALVAQARDEEAEVCADLCEIERAHALEVGISDPLNYEKRGVYAVAAAYAATCRDNIRARIAGRKA